MTLHFVQVFYCSHYYFQYQLNLFEILDTDIFSIQDFRQANQHYGRLILSVKEEKNCKRAQSKIETSASSVKIKWLHTAAKTNQARICIDVDIVVMFIIAVSRRIIGRIFLTHSGVFWNVLVIVRLFMAFPHMIFGQKHHLEYTKTLAIIPNA